VSLKPSSNVHRGQGHLRTRPGKKTRLKQAKKHRKYTPMVTDRPGI